MLAKPVKGELRWSNEGPVARITLRGRKRRSFLLSTCRTEAEALERMGVLAGLAARFRRARVSDTPDASKLLDMAAGAAPAMLRGVLQVAGELCGGELDLDDGKSVPTFGDLASDWTSGRLHERHPDHVKVKKDAGLDATRLEALSKVDVGGIKLGDIPLDRFTVDHAEAAMRQLPKEARRPATRWQYAQLINRVLTLAVYPCRIIAANPLPKGFMPKVGKPPAYPFLYPEEDRKLLGKVDIPIAHRMLYGFWAREGMRLSEAMALEFEDFNLELGAVSLDKNKTDDPRAWALNPGVTEALRRWKEMRGAGDSDSVFGEVRAAETDRLAENLRRHLKSAGVDRAELHEPGANRRPLRAHDLRGTFVTLSLANGRTETWVADRTGHKSSQMINRYRRAARSASELGLGELSPMVDSVPELGQSSPRDCPKRVVQRTKKRYQPSDITTESRSGGMADAADSKSVEGNLV